MSQRKTETEIETDSRWMGGQIDRLMDLLMDRWIDGLIDGQMDRFVDRETNGWIDRYMH